MNGRAAPGGVSVRERGLGAHALQLRALARAPAWTITALLGCAYLIASPASADLAAVNRRSASAPSSYSTAK